MGLGDAANEGFVDDGRLKGDINVSGGPISSFTGRTGEAGEIEGLGEPRKSGGLEAVTVALGGLPSEEVEDDGANLARPTGGPTRTEVSGETTEGLSLVIGPSTSAASY